MEAILSRGCMGWGNLSMMPSWDTRSPVGQRGVEVGALGWGEGSGDLWKR